MEAEAKAGASSFIRHSSFVIRHSPFVIFSSLLADQNKDAGGQRCLCLQHVRLLIGRASA